MKLFLALLFSLYFVNSVIAQFGEPNLINNSEPRNNMAVQVFDINNDGLDDVLASNNLGQVIIYKNLGDRNFKQLSNPFDIAPPYSQLITFIGKFDLDLDGDLDLATITTSGVVKVFNNIGDEEFLIEEVYNSDLFASPKLFFTDLNYDGIPDIICTQLDGTITKILLQNSINNFTPIETPNSLQSKKILHAEDLNGDQITDLVVATGNQIIKMYGSQDFIFTESVIAAGVTSPFHCVFGDISGDENTDLIYYSSGSLVTITNLVDNSPQIQFVSNISGNISELDLADMDNDSNLDIITCKNLGSSEIYHWHKNNGSNAFTESFEIISVESSTHYKDQLRLTNFDTDELPDMLVLRTPSNTTRLLDAVFNDINTTQSFLQKHISEPHSFLYDSFKLDVDNDGLQDIVRVNRVFTSVLHVYWYENLGNGNFSTHKLLSSLTNNSSNNTVEDLFFADLNNDNLDDLIVYYDANDYRVSYCPNLGNGEFGDLTLAVTSNSTFDNLNGITPIDIDEDGDLDLIYKESGQDNLQWFENLGNFEFTASQSITSFYGSVLKIEYYDLDNDNLNDLIVHTSNFNSIKIQWLKGTGSLSFNPIQLIHSRPLTAEDGRTFYFSTDLNQDNNLDLVYGKDSLFWLLGDGNGLFSSPILLDSTFNSDHPMKFFDFDGDGDMDITSKSESNLFGFSTSNLNLLVNDGSNNFDKLVLSENHSASAPFYYQDQSFNNDIVHVFDFDNDNDVDVFFTAKDSLLGMKNLLYEANLLSGKIFIDLNQNGLKDSIEQSVSNIEVSAGQNNSVFSNFFGDYFYSVENLTFGDYNLSPVLESHWQTTSNPYTFTVDDNFNSEDSVDFGIYPAFNLDSVSTQIQSGFPRCNDTINLWVSLVNRGSSIIPVICKLEIDPNLEIISQNFNIDSIQQNTLYWTTDSLEFFESKTFAVQVKMPDFNFIGDTLTSSIEIIDENQEGLFNSYNESRELVVCAYDPNDKNSTPSQFDPIGLIEYNMPTTINYKIRFQNTGNDTAAVVLIKDQLDNNLNWETLKNVHASHNFEYSIQQNGEVTFRFPEINLPDSNVNFLESQGFVNFDIEINPILPAGTEIHNFAKIYFDLNPPVLTNTRIHTIGENTLSLNEDKSIGDVTIYPNPNSSGIFKIKTDLKIDEIIVLDNLGRMVPFERNDNYITLKQEGNYFIKITSGETKVIKRVIFNQ